METPTGTAVTVADEVRAEAERLAADPSFPAAFVARVRAATGRLAVTEGGRDDVRSAALLVEQQAVIEFDVPVAGRALPQRLVKLVVRKLIGWYVRFLGHQVAVLGQATARLGLSTAERFDRMEAEHRADRTAMQAEIARLQARVTELEARSS